MIARRNQIHFSVGAGIVADSTPAAEYDETLVKATAMLDVLR
jgi:anthranilate/para-aminobenzoate synthase component I